MTDKELMMRVANGKLIDEVAYELLSKRINSSN